MGDFLKSIMRTGKMKDWRQVMKESTGESLNAKALVTYFAPLLQWLKQENKGRTHTLPEKLN